MEAALKKKHLFKMSAKMKNILVDVIVYSFVALLVYAAVDKIYNFENFKAVLNNSVLLSKYGTLVAWFAVSAELTISALLLLESTKRTGLVCATILMIIFTGYVITMMSTGNLICGCGGFIKEMSWPMHLAFNGTFILLGIVGLSLLKDDKKMDLKKE